MTASVSTFDLTCLVMGKDNDTKFCLDKYCYVNAIVETVLEGLGYKLSVTGNMYNPNDVRREHLEQLATRSNNGDTICQIVEMGIIDSYERGDFTYEQAVRFLTE